ncbi:hypothetical protein Tco_0489239 [Tanacetum coccineum]
MKVLTMKMEILLEPTSNKLLVVPVVHSFCALSTLRRSGLRTASASAKPCQGDSLEFYLSTTTTRITITTILTARMITNNNRIEGKKPLGLMLSPQLKTIGMLEAFPYLKGPTRFSNSDACYHNPEMYEHADPKVTTSHGSNTSQQRMLKRFTMANDLEECSKITQVKGTKPKSTTLCTKLSMNEESKTTSLKLNVQDLGC